MDAIIALFNKAWVVRNTVIGLNILIFSVYLLLWRRGSFMLPFKNISVYFSHPQSVLSSTLCFLSPIFAKAPSTWWNGVYAKTIPLVNRLNGTIAVTAPTKALWGPVKFKERLSRYRDSHYNDKRGSRALFNGNIYTGKQCLYIEMVPWVLYKYPIRLY